jgi:hypothetical protein
MEVNNGRLAMLGIVGFLSADKVAGSVLSLNDITIPCDGNVMAPFIADGMSLALLDIQDIVATV